MRISPKIRVTLFLALVWIGTIVFGSKALLSYETTPGRIGAVPSSWPTASSIVRSHDASSLIVLAHPHCPCTKATVHELAQILAQAHGTIRAYVLYLKPQNSTDDWNDTALLRSAAAILGVAVLPDIDGREAKLFGVETSGHALLFNPQGELLFSGGITASRGHEGDNAGESAIIALANNHTVTHSRTPVFGCPLTGPAAKESKCLH